MGCFQVCDALSILFKLEKLHVKHIEGFILLSRESGEQQKISKLLIENSSSITRKNSPIGLTKVDASMVRRMFAIETMSC